MQYEQDKRAAEEEDRRVALEYHASHDLVDLLLEHNEQQQNAPAGLLEHTPLEVARRIAGASNAGKFVENDIDGVTEVKSPMQAFSASALSSPSAASSSAASVSAFGSSPAAAAATPSAGSRATSPGNGRLR
jgi:hypothetical protein